MSEDTRRALSRGAVLWALGIIFAANFLNYLDRSLVSALEEQLQDPKDGLGLDSGQFGLLWTLFTLGYMVCAMPIGFLADRSNRPRLFALCVLIWSIATVVSGMAEERFLLYAARVMIGVGEAGCLIIGPALVSDYFSKKVRGKALSVFYLGLPLGGTSAYIMAGLLLEQGVSWRTMFYIAGAPGFLVAALIFMLRDPPRGKSETGGHGTSTTRFRDYVQLLKTPTLLLIILAQSFAVFTLVPLLHFGVKFFEDFKNMEAGEARITLGVMALIAGALGSGLSGFIGDKLAKRMKGAYALMAGIAFLIGWPCLLIGFHSDDRAVFLPALTFGCFCYFLCMPAVNTQIANVTSPAQRATAWALAVFILHLLGDTLSPWLFGILDETMDRKMVFTMFSFSVLLAGICCLIAAFTARRDTDRLEKRLGVSPEEIAEGQPLGH